MSLELRRETLEVDVRHILDGQTVAVEIVFRKDLAVPPRAILVCLTGGGVTRRFFDLRFEDNASFSLAQALADRGYAVVMIDHLGVGGSSRPDDGFDLTPDVLADSAAEAARAAINFICAGSMGTGECSPPIFGVGHSMGGMISVLVQARHSIYDGLVLLGYVANGSPNTLREGGKLTAGKPEQIRASLTALTIEMFGGAIKPAGPAKDTTGLAKAPGKAPSANTSRLFRPEAADPEGTLALKAVIAPVLNASVLFALIPGSHAPEMVRVRRPILVIVGEHDFAYPPKDLEKLFPNAPSISTFLPQGIGHNVFNFPGRDRVFACIDEWIEAAIREGF